MHLNIIVEVERLRRHIFLPSTQDVLKISNLIFANAKSLKVLTLHILLFLLLLLLFLL